MKRKLLCRCLIGAPVGLSIGIFITILISLTVGDGNYYPVAPELAQDCGGVLNAVLAQTACLLLYGAVWGGMSLIWEMERWGLLRQTLTHMAACSLTTLAVAYGMRWMGRSLTGILIYFGIFFGIYLMIWLSQYLAIRRRVRAINAKLENWTEE